MDAEMQALAKLIEDEEQQGEYYDSIVQEVTSADIHFGNNLANRSISPPRPSKGSTNSRGVIASPNLSPARIIKASVSPEGWRSLTPIRSTTTKTLPDMEVDIQTPTSPGHRQPSVGFDAFNTAVESHSDLVTAAHSPVGKGSKKRPSSRSPSIKRCKSPPDTSRGLSVSLQLQSSPRGRVKGRTRSPSRSQSLAAQNERYFYSPVRSRKSRSCCRLPRCSVGSPDDGTHQYQEDEPLSSFGAPDTTTDDTLPLYDSQPQLPSPTPDIDSYNDTIANKYISPVRTRREPSTLPTPAAQSISQSVQTEPCSPDDQRPNVVNTEVEEENRLLRAATVIKEFHDTSRSKIIEMEHSRRSSLMAKLDADVKMAEQLALVSAAETAGRELIQQLQRALACERFNIFKASSFSRRQGLAVAVHCEERARKDICNYEFLLRGALLYIFKKGCRATFFQSHLTKVNDITSKEAHARLRLFLKIKRFSEWATNVDVHFTHHETIQRNKLREEEVAERILLTHCRQQHLTTVRAFQVSMSYIHRDELSQREQLRFLHDSKMRLIAEKWNASLQWIRLFKGKRNELQVLERSSRSTILQEWSDSLAVIVSCSLLEDYHRLTAAMLFKASLQNADLLKYLYQLNFWTNSELDKMILMEEAESDKRAAVEAAELAARKELAQLMSQFSQRFDDTHNRELMLSEETRNRRSLEWHEIALRNAIVQYHVDSLADIAGAAKHRQLSKNLEVDAIGFGELPFSPEPRQVKPTRDIDGLVLRLGSVATQLRDRVRSSSVEHVVPVPTLPAVSKPKMSNFRVVQELASLYPKGSKILTQALTTRINTILTQGYLTREDELHLSTICASIIEQQPDSSLINKSLSKVFVLLNLLIDI
eukprot:TRINITY_DN3376_c3_g1_i1.p1 TRINITY_DN3376_c3_g1~~TRINITY_DN3376_c3_g1_i1.p1  ORF type:complete len:877 (+),score=121.72 TRINITY_DN3376_c3_g1_i1:73-2703(+)